MKCTIASNRRTFRNKALAGAIVAALAFGAADVALAETLGPQSSYTLNPALVDAFVPSGWSQDGSLLHFMEPVGNDQYLNQSVAAGVTNGTVALGADASQANMTINLNNIQAGVRGNVADSSVDLGLLRSDGNGNEGIGILSGQLADGAHLSSNVQDSAIADTLTNYTEGSISHGSNTIAATTTLGSASNQVSGALPDSFQGASTGSIDYDFNGASTPSTLDSTGSVSIGNLQTTVNAGAGGDSLAHVDNAAISVTDSPSPPSVDLTSMAVDVTADDNVIAAQYNGNTSDNGFIATSGTRFEGSATLTNGQTNIDDGGSHADDAAAAVQGSNIGVLMAGALDGSVSLSSSSIGAATQGNDATNTVAFASGVDVLGNKVYGSTDAQIGNAQLKGDLALLNTQGNQDTAMQSYVGDSAITAQVMHLDSGSSMTLNDDSVSASAGGSHAANLIQADAASSFTADTALASMQVNQSTPVTAAVDGARIVAGVMGNVNEAGLLEGLDDVSGGSVTVDRGAIAATADGNTATNTVDVGGSQVGVWDAVDSVFANITNAGPAISTGNAGIGAGNVQANEGGKAIDASVGEGWIGAYFNGGVTGASVTANDDALTAHAGGNSVATSVTVSGTDGSANVQAGNAQSNDSTIGAHVVDAKAGIYLGGGSAEGASSLTVSDDAQKADASGNLASNSLAVDFSNYSLGATVNDWSAASSAMSVVGTALLNNKAKADLALVSTQKNTGGVTADVTGGTIGIDVGDHPWPGVAGSEPERGNVTASTLVVSDNTASARAVANQVGNQLDVDTGNLSTGSGQSEQVATIANLQYNSGGATAAVSTNGDDVRDLEQIGAFVHGNATAMDATASNNHVSAFAGGDIATNTMTFAGTSYVPTSTATGVNGVMTGLSVSAGFSLQNAQVDTGGSRSASVDNGNIGFSMTDGALDDRHAITDSTLAVSDNTVSAEARDNYATNGLYLGADYQQQNGSMVLVAAPLSSLNTTAALQNVQTSNGDTSSSANGLLGVIAGHYDIAGSDASISRNTVSSVAGANTASNQLNVAAGTLSGDSRYVDGSYTYGAASIQPNSTILPQFVLADYGVANTQTVDGTIGASLLDTDGNGNGTGIGLALGEGDLNGGSVTVSDNVQQALAQANAATSTLSLQGTQIDASASVFSQQDAAGTVNATGGLAADALGFGVQVNGSVGATTALPITVGGNTMLAQAGFNDATNQLHVTGASTIGGSDADFRAVSRTDGTVYAQADESLLNAQTAAGAATATLNPGMSGIEVIASDTQSAIGNAGASSNLAVSGNQFAAQTTLNSASNVVQVDGAASIAATAAVANQQSASGSASSQVGNADVGIYNRGLAGTAGGAITNAAMTVADNRLSASASGNSASNAINVQPTALNAAASIDTQASIDSDASQAVADYAVLNVQGNAAGISAGIAGSSIGVNADAGTVAARGSASPMLNSMGTVTGNQAMASASGNSASNSIMLASVAGMPSAALVSSQVNSAAISASVSNVTIGVVAGIGSNSPVTVTGNTISASATGNSAINHIGIGN